MKYSIFNIHALVKHQKKVFLLESKTNEKAIMIIMNHLKNQNFENIHEQ